MPITRSRKIAAAAITSVAMAGAVGTAVAVSGTGPDDSRAGRTATVEGRLHSLNNAAGHGKAEVTISGRNLRVVLQVRRVLADMPHAQHIHFGKTARQECPNVRDDTDVDHRLSTAEGLPAYGPVRVSLTTSGDTSPDSTLAVDRYPTAADGRYSYTRTIRVTKGLAEKIAAGKGVLVIHGIDYNHNGHYDFDGAGASELDPTLPAEATDPAVCGVLHAG